MSFNDGDIRYGFVHTDGFRILTEVMLKFVTVISKKLSPCFKKNEKDDLGRKAGNKAYIYIRIEMAYKRKAHKSAHTCMFHILK